MVETVKMLIDLLIDSSFVKTMYLFFRVWKVIVYDANHDTFIINIQGETWRKCILLWLGRTLLITPLYLYVVT